MKAMAQLSAHHREVFVLRDLEGRSYDEIAAITGANIGTVKSRLSRARDAFGDIIRRWID
jgi:RNA polymerase sigma-70 factor (ECF subfamily)